MKTSIGVLRGLGWVLGLSVLVIGLGRWTYVVASQGRGGQDPAADPFRGVATSAGLRANLFPIRASGVSTRAVRDATVTFLASLTDVQRSATTYPVDDSEWRKWNNIHRYARQGVNFKDMTPTQRERAFDVMRAGLSAKGFETSRGIMRLNGYIADFLNNYEEYGEFLYHLTVMGTPSETAPWGWQLDGHHLIVNYFVLGDQVVMTPTFMGSEPVSATTGQYTGTKVLQAEQDRGLAFMRSLSAEAQQQATIAASKTANHAQAQAFRDNLTLDFAGLRASTLPPAQQEHLVAVIKEYVDNMTEGHARVRLAEVRQHLADTWFAWVGGTGQDDVFYYRIHSPVILIEFDHQTPVALPGPRVPGKAHIHTVVRTPNGNDYGKDLLRQHYDRHKNDPAHGHTHR